MLDGMSGQDGVLNREINIWNNLILDWYHLFLRYI